MVGGLHTHLRKRTRKLLVIVSCGAGRGPGEENMGKSMQCKM
jgi:hypothetical protein